jgi:hypothetical protein
MFMARRETMEIHGVTIPLWLAIAVIACTLSLGAAVIWRLSGRLTLLRVGKVEIQFDPKQPE